MQKFKENRIVSYAVILVTYALATLLAIFIFGVVYTPSMVRYVGLPGELILLVPMLWADAIATAFVWLVGIVFDNSSVYDPYWSVAPMVLFVALATKFGFSLGAILVIVAVCVWGVRLTANWAINFKNLNHQDWRYDGLKQRHPKAWHIVNLFGIHYIPTLVVFLAMVPGFFIIIRGIPAGTWTYVACAACIGCAVLQLVSDLQMRCFRKKNPGQVCTKGLWKWSRHPNYLGEVAMWWGLYAMCVASDPAYWWTGVGALVNTLLFIFISIPMMEKRELANKPDYAEYKKTTWSALLLLPPKASKKPLEAEPENNTEM